MRIGQGYDVHRLITGRPLVIGGVTIDHSMGLDGHSDADVLLHAVCDALLGAAGLGDIGQHFPDSNAQYAGVDSRQLVRAVMHLLRQQNYVVLNLDSTIIAQQPKLAPFIPQMRSNIADDLAIIETAVNVKATTTEQLGFEGQQQGIAAQACVLIEQQTQGLAGDEEDFYE